LAAQKKSTSQDAAVAKRAKPSAAPGGPSKAAKKTALKKTPKDTPAAKPQSAKKTPVKKTPVKASATRKAADKTTAAPESVAKKAAAEKTTDEKALAKTTKAALKKTGTAKTGVTTKAPVNKTQAKTTAAKTTAAKTTAAKTTAAKTTAAKKTSVKKAAAKTAPVASPESVAPAVKKSAMKKGSATKTKASDPSTTIDPSTGTDTDPHTDSGQNRTTDTTTAPSEAVPDHRAEEPVQKISYRRARRTVPQQRPRENGREMIARLRAERSAALGIERVDHVQRTSRNKAANRQLLESHARTRYWQPNRHPSRQTQGANAAGTPVTGQGDSFEINSTLPENTDSSDADKRSQIRDSLKAISSDTPGSSVTAGADQPGSMETAQTAALKNLAKSLTKPPATTPTNTLAEGDPIEDQNAANESASAEAGAGGEAGAKKTPGKTTRTSKRDQKQEQGAVRTPTGKAHKKLSNATSTQASRKRVTADTHSAPKSVPPKSSAPKPSAPKPSAPKGGRSAPDLKLVAPPEIQPETRRTAETQTVPLDMPTDTPEATATDSPTTEQLSPQQPSRGKTVSGANLRRRAATRTTSKAGETPESRLEQRLAIRRQAREAMLANRAAAQKLKMETRRELAAAKAKRHQALEAQKQKNKAAAKSQGGDAAAARAAVHHRRQSDRQSLTETRRKNFEARLTARLAARKDRGTASEQHMPHRQASDHDARQQNRADMQALSKARQDKAAADRARRQEDRQAQARASQKAVSARISSREQARLQKQEQRREALRQRAEMLEESARLDAKMQAESAYIISVERASDVPTFVGSGLAVDRPAPQPDPLAVALMGRDLADTDSGSSTETDSETGIDGGVGDVHGAHGPEMNGPEMNGAQAGYILDTTDEVMTEAEAIVAQAEAISAQAESLAEESVKLATETETLLAYQDDHPDTNLAGSDDDAFIHEVFGSGEEDMGEADLSEAELGNGHMDEDSGQDPASVPSSATGLESIDGLGEGMRDRLQQAGIIDLQALAGADLDALRDELGPISRLANLDAWQARAQELVNRL